MRTFNEKTSEIKVSVTASNDEWKNKVSKAFEEIQKGLTLKGFRKGHVPLEEAKKHIKPQEAWSKALPKMLDILVKDAAKELKEDDQIISSPNYLVEKITDTELEVAFIYPTFPNFDLGDYKNHGIKVEAEKVDEKLVEGDLKRIQEKHAILKDKEDKTIAKGDIAIFDFEGFVDEKPFEGGKAEKYQLEIGSGQFIPGFEDQMIGAKAGDAKDINVKFPEEYQVKELKGKDAVFKITVHEVKVKELPELNDDLAKEAGIKDVKTLDELKVYIKDILGKQSEQIAQTKFQKDVFAKLLENVEINIPTQLVGREMETLQKQFAEQIKKQGLDVKKYLEMTGLKQEAFLKQFKDQALNKLKTAFIYAKIAKEEKLEVTEEEYAAEYEKISKVYGQSVDAIKGTINKAQLQIPIINQKVLDILKG